MADSRVSNVRLVVGYLVRVIVLCGLLALVAVLGKVALRLLVNERAFLGIVFLLPFAFSILSTIGWIFYCLHRPLRRLRWRICGFGVLVMWGFAISWFVSRGNVWENLAGPHLLNLVLYLSTCLIFFGAIAFSMVGRTIFNQIRTLMRMETKRCVFWGLSDRDLLLARSIVKSKALWQVDVNLPIEQSYDSGAKQRMVDLLDEIDAAWSFVDFTRPGRRCHKGYRHYLLSSDGHGNIALADRIVESFCRDEKDCQGKVIYIRAGDIDNEEMFSAWSRSVYERTGHMIRVVVIKEPELIARQFVELYPPSSLSSNVLTFGEDATVNLRQEAAKTLLIGFDHSGKAVLNAHLCVSRFVSAEDRKTLVVAPVTVVDMQEERWDSFVCNEPEIEAHKEEYGLEFVSHKVGTRAFEEWLHANCHEFRRFVFCLPNDASSVRAAIRVRNLLIEWAVAGEGRELLVRLADPMLNQFRSINYQVLPIKFFGNLEDLYSFDFLARHSTNRQY